jgi:hypothetical protein
MRVIILLIFFFLIRIQIFSQINNSNKNRCLTNFYDNNIIDYSNSKDLQVFMNIQWGEVYREYIYMGHHAEEIGILIANSDKTNNKIQFKLEKIDSLIFRISTRKTIKNTISLYKKLYCYALNYRQLMFDLQEFLNNSGYESKITAIEKFEKLNQKEFEENKQLSGEVSNELNQLRNDHQLYSLQKFIDNEFGFSKKNEDNRLKEEDDEFMIAYKKLKEKLLILCRNNVQNHFRLNSESEFGKELCSCIIDEMEKKDIILDVKKYNFNDFNDADFNDTFIKCIENTITKTKIEKKIEIIGENLFTKLPYISLFGNGYRIKINLNGIIKYFYFDTGASDVLIDSITEQQLIENGTINSNSKFESGLSVGPDNSKYLTNNTYINNVQIGDYKLNNVKISIYKNAPILLCGMSLFKSFSSFKIDHKKRIITLYK